MCGITAMSRAAGATSLADGRNYALAAVLAIEERGPHATGYGWADKSGHPWYWKSPGRARDVAHEAPLPKGLRTLIGHTRWATHGSPKDNLNNHPVIAPGLVLVHNGMLKNHGELHEALDVPPAGEVDSEALAALLSYGPEVMGASHPCELLELVRGDAAIAWLDADDVDVLHLARLAGRPMAVGWTKRGDLLMSSTAATLRTGCGLAKVGVHDVKVLPEGTYIRVEAGEVTDWRQFRVFPGLPPRERVPARRVVGMPKRGGELIERAVHDGLVETARPWRVIPNRPTRSRWSTEHQRWEPVR